MPQQNKNLIYFRLLSLFKEKKNIRMAQIQKMLENENLPSSPRSIERYKRDLERLGFRINYDTSSKTYSLDIEYNSLPERIINLMVASEFMQGLTVSPKALLNYIDFDKHTVSAGVEHLPLLFDAIRQNRWVKLTYRRYDAGANKTHKVAPLFLKEYNHRWYVLVIIRDTGKLKNDAPVLFGLDRIVHLELEEIAPKDLFEQTKMYQQMKKDYGTATPFDIFDEIIGVTFSDNAVSKVVLSFSPTQSFYLKSQPWHHSQEILIDNKDEFQIALYVRPNDDLIRLILSQGSQVRVLEPLELRENIVKTLQATVSHYC